MIILLFGFVLIAFAVYSYALIDPNITFLNNAVWESFRGAMVQFGYYQRTQSWYVYAVLIIALFVLHYVMVRKYKQLQPMRVAVTAGIILLAAYPFLTHDFFNYMFDAKILTFYHQNPYLHKALDFPADPWLRFMHWTHRTYPYGPSFLLITLIPSFLSMGKFLLDFLLFKTVFVGCYLGAVYVLTKQSRRWAMVFATHPLILVEGLINGHNDLIAVAITIIGIFLVAKNREITGRALLVISAAIKYTTLPVIIAGRNRWMNYAALAGVVALLGYLSFRSEVQPWYFLTLFVFVPYIEEAVKDIDIFLAGLLFSYYPYIALGGWDTPQKVNQKHVIIGVALIANVVYIIWRRSHYLVPRKWFLSR